MGWKKCHQSTKRFPFPIHRGEEALFAIECEYYLGDDGGKLAVYCE